MIIESFIDFAFMIETDVNLSVTQIIVRINSAEVSVMFESRSWNLQCWC